MKLSLSLGLSRPLTVVSLCTCVTLTAVFGQRVQQASESPIPELGANATLSQSASQPTSEYENEDGIITLEEFEVKASSMKDSYIASEATTGTRLGGAILDTPFNVAVITQEIADDFLLGDDELMGFVSGVSIGSFEDDGEGLGSVNIRGFSVVSLRDGFKYYNHFGFGLSNDRTEVLKGPASIMYGRSTPGGLKNVISRKPAAKPAYVTEASLSRYSTYSAGARGTGPIIPNKLFYVAAARYSHNESPIDFYWRKTHNFYGKVLWKISKDSALTFGLDYKRSRGTHGTGSSPGGYYVETIGQFPLLDGGYISSGDISSDYALPTDPSTGLYNPYKNIDSVNFGPSPAIRGSSRFAELAYFNFQGPDSNYKEDAWATSLLYEHRINRILSFRLSALHTDYSDRDRYWRLSNSRYYEIRGPIQNLRDPFIDNYDRDTNAVQAEMLATFRTGSITHRILFLADYTDIDIHRTNYTYSDVDIDALPNTVKYLNVYNPDWGNGVDWSKANTVSHIQDRDDQSWGLTASYSLSLLRDRLVLMGSGRYDNIEAHQTDPYLSGNRKDARADYGDWSYSLTANWKFIPQKLTGYINHSTSFNDSSYTLSIDSGTGTFVKPSNSTGYELGIKGSGLFNKRLSFTASIAQIEQENVKDTNPEYVSGNTSNNPQYLGTLSHRSRAIELQTDWLLTEGLVLKVGAGYTQSKVVSATRPWVVGKTLRGVSKWDFNAMLRYKFSKGSFFDGLQCGVAANYRSSFTAIYDQYFETTPLLPVYSTDINYSDLTDKSKYVNRGWKYQLNNPETWLLQYESYTNPSYLTFQAFISYKWKWRSYNPMIQLNCKNITNENHITYQGRWYNDGRIFSITAKVNF